MKYPVRKYRIEEVCLSPLLLTVISQKQFLKLNLLNEDVPC